MGKCVVGRDFSDLAKFMLRLLWIKGDDASQVYLSYQIYLSWVFLHIEAVRFLSWRFVRHSILEHLQDIVTMHNTNYVLVLFEPRNSYNINAFKPTN